MKWQHATKVVLLVMGNLALAGHVVAQVSRPPGSHVPDYLAPMPYYFSGTYNFASGVAVPTPFYHIATADLLISQDGSSWTLLKHYSYELEPTIYAVPMAAPFDSTHFDNGELVYVKLTMEDSSGFTDQEIDSTVVKNNAVCFNFVGEDQNPWYNGAQPATDALYEMGYGVSADFDGNWFPEDYLEALDGANVSYVSAHGSQGNHSDGFDPLPPPLEAPPIYAEDGQGDFSYEGARIAQMGTGDPPYNSTHNPPIQFLFLQCCFCGSDNSFSTALIPYTWYSNWVTDQCWVGWASGIHAINNADVVTALFNYLEETKTIWTARDLLNDILNNSNHPNYFELVYFFDENNLRVFGEFGEDYLSLYLQIWGDHATRISGLYNGGHDYPVSWK